MPHQKGHNVTEPDINEIKRQVLDVLAHPEATDGLYFRNFFHLHEEDERAAVEGDEMSILEALYDLVEEGKISMKSEGEEATFHLIGPRPS